MKKANTKAFNEYTDIVAQIKELEAKKDKLSELIFADMVEMKIDQLKLDVGTFYFTTRKTWKYPEHIKEIEGTLKLKKKEAEEKGEATFEEKKSLSYKQNDNW